MPKISTKNGEQDVTIQKVSDGIQSLETRFNAFCNNDFKHLRSQVDKIIWTGIIGFLLTIGVVIISKYL